MNNKIPDELGAVFGRDLEKAGEDLGCLEVMVLGIMWQLG